MPTISENIEKLLKEKNIDQIVEDKINAAINSKIDDIVEVAINNILHKENSETLIKENDIDQIIETAYNAIQKEEKENVNNFDIEEKAKEISKEIEENKKFRIYNKLTNKFEEVTEDNKDYMPEEIWLKYEVGSYLSSVSAAMNRLLEIKTSEGLFEMTQEDTDKESEADKKFYIFLNNLTWEDLDMLIKDNENIKLENLPPILRNKIKPVDAYYIILKNTLSTNLNKILNINIPAEVKYWNVDEYLQSFLVKELLLNLNIIIDNTILKYNRQIFNALFNKKYYLNEI